LWVFRRFTRFGASIVYVLVQAPVE